MKDMADFPPSLHLAAWKIGAWRVLMTGTQTTMSLGWILRYLFDFRQSLPERCKFHHNVAESSSGEELGEPKKRNAEKEGTPEAELNK